MISKRKPLGRFRLRHHGRVYFYILRHRGGKHGVAAKLFLRRHNHSHALPPFRERQLQRRINECTRTL